MIAEMLQNQLFLYFFVLIASIYIIFRSAGYIVFGISNYAKKFGVSEYLVGFLVIAMGMSSPEFVSSVMGVMQGDSGIVIGSFFGAVIAALLLTLGIVAIFGRKISLESRLLRESRHIYFFIALLPAIIVLTGNLTRIKGIIMISVFISFIIYLWRKEGTFGRIKEDVKFKIIWKDALIFLIALAALLLSARWMVFSALQIAHNLNISSFLISLLVVGLGSSLPDISVQIRAIKTGHMHIAFGDVLGSCLVDMLLMLGIVILISPFTINVHAIILSVIFYLGGLALVLWLVKYREIDYRHGILMVSLYILFIALEILSEIGII